MGTNRGRMVSTCLVTSMKRAYLIHGWSGTPDRGFFPWLKRELESRGYTVEVPRMPDADAPDYDKWVPFIESLIGTPDSETLLVGHSMGGQTALRWLERLPEGAVVGKIVLVAPVVETIAGMSVEDEIVARPWLRRPFDDVAIRRFGNRVVGIFSDNDPYIPLSSEALLRERFGMRTMVEHAKGHFSESDGTVEVPAILNAIDSWL